MERAPTPGRTNEQLQRKERQPRVSVQGFYGKILDVRVTANEKKPILYKLTVGNDDGQGNTRWQTVVSAEPHVVRFIEQHIEELHPRYTHLSAECYPQVRKDARGYTRVEYYAVNLKYGD